LIINPLAVNQGVIPFLQEIFIFASGMPGKAWFNLFKKQMIPAF
jgi:hypothetical protein